MTTTSFESLKHAIEERVQRDFPTVLFEAMVKQHKRHGFKSGCGCAYCVTKRSVSHSPWGHAKHYGYDDRYRQELKDAEELGDDW